MSFLGIATFPNIDGEILKDSLIIDPKCSSFFKESIVTLIFRFSKVGASPSKISQISFSIASISFGFCNIYDIVEAKEVEMF